MAAGIGMFFSTNSLFVIPVCESLGISRGQYSMHRTVITIVNGFTLPFYGKIVRRLGEKKILLIGSAALGIVTACYSFAENLWHLYFIAFFNGFFVNAVSFMVVSLLMSNWFKDKKGFATGLAFSGSGLGGAIMLPIVGRVIELYDWRFAYRFVGAFGIAVLIPMILIFIKNTPEDVGLSPYVSDKPDTSGIKRAEREDLNLTVGMAVKTKGFWLLAVSFLFVSCYASATINHTAAFMHDIGFPPVTVSLIASLFMVFLTAGKIAMGFVYDKFGTMAGNAVLIVCSGIFPIAALLSHIPVMPWLYALTAGVASCGFSVPIPVLLLKYFGTKDYPMMLSVFTMITTLGSAVSVPLMGAAYDQAGNYNVAWIASLALVAAVASCLIATELTHWKKTA